ncbi:hypothetical protein HPB48_013008 [Haemaphysalis longicornis]|uniref:Methyltransferase type 11 domain-containing protein n=1 Tax=Haemaphysalis longicornis TaxID=44386 RepID=A0A9J6FWV9_HAELO|nr:hypothetical protein HPB48_013008 [Haemaphysalis longicornis]
MSDVPDGYFDCVVLTYVLCSALDGRKLLGECRRVLAKGGLFLFSEHVAHPLHGLARLMQDVVTPFYKRITCGCHLNRESGNLIQAAGVFKRVHIHEVRVELPSFFNRHVYGYAVA